MVVLLTDGFDWAFLAWTGVGILIFAFVAIRRAVRNRLSDSWMQVQGVIESSTAEVEKRGDWSVQVARITYSYRYEGEYYSGAYTKDFLRERSAEEFAASLPKGTPLTVRVHPRHPDQSVMREDDNSSVAVAVALQRKP